MLDQHQAAPTDTTEPRRRLRRHPHWVRQLTGQDGDRWFNGVAAPNHRSRRINSAILTEGAFPAR